MMNIRSDMPDTINAYMKNLIQLIIMIAQYKMQLTFLHQSLPLLLLYLLFHWTRHQWTILLPEIKHFESTHMQCHVRQHTYQISVVHVDCKSKWSSIEGLAGDKTIHKWHLYIHSAHNSIEHYASLYVILLVFEASHKSHKEPLKTAQKKQYYCA